MSGSGDGKDRPLSVTGMVFRVSGSSSPPAGVSAFDRLAGRAWRAFKTVKTGILLLGLIGASCIYGTMFYAANTVLGDNAIPLAKARVFNAPWFTMLLGAFFVQFVVSTWHVTKMSFGIWWKRDFAKSRTFLEVGRGRACLADVPGGADGIEKTLRERFTRVHRSGNRFFAHRGLRTRIGPTVIHTGIVIILLAGLGRIYLDRRGEILSEGQFRGIEGETSSEVLHPVFRDQIMGPNNVAAMRIPYDVTVLDFDVINHANSNEPAYFSSLVKVKSHETGEVRVAKLDMNHSLSFPGALEGPPHLFGLISGARWTLEFHQAAYQPMPPIQLHRTDFDVRDAKTGERIAVTDATPGARVQIGETDLMLEVDGEAAGSPWRIYSAANPREPIAGGALRGSAAGRTFAFQVQRIFTDFRVDKSLKPYNASKEVGNVAVEVALFEDGLPSGTSWVFLDPMIAGKMPAAHEQARLVLQDIQTAGEPETTDWTDPSASRVILAVQDRETSVTLGAATVQLGQRSRDFVIGPPPGTESAPAGDAKYAVFVLGRSMAYMTVLSVVNEPAVPFYMAGVAFIAVGAMLTFAGRYRAFHGEWDEEAGVLRLALIPRFGKGPDPAEFDRLLAALGGRRVDQATEPEPDAIQAETVEPEAEPLPV
ncbi:cytochrome c biogenesis protein ResB [Candidatus Poribacteria bacterium]|nr:cytochrome c biogenesis protein ResB [Candidatus Poribacteria bacterium]